MEQIINIKEERRKLFKTISAFEERKGSTPKLQGRMTKQSRMILSKYHSQETIDQLDFAFKRTYKMIISSPMNMDDRRINEHIRLQIRNFIKESDLELLKIRVKTTNRGFNMNDYNDVYKDILLSDTIYPLTKTIIHAFIYMNIKGDLELNLATKAENGKTIIHRYKLI